MSTSVSAVYLHVVDSVVGKLREEFLNEGVDDSVLNELQSLWEMKMLQCGAIQGPIERNSVQKAVVPTPVHDLNVPYEGPEEYETPTAEMLFPPTPMQTPMQTPLPADTPGHQYFPSGSSDYAATPDIGGGPFARSPYLPQPSPWTNQRPLGVDVNVAYEEAREQEEIVGSSSRAANNVGALPSAPQAPMKDFFTANPGKRKRDDYAAHFLPDGYIPQQDGSGDTTGNCSFHRELHNRGVSDAVIIPGSAISQNALSIPQSDGFPDDYNDGVRHEDYSTPSYYAATPSIPNVGTPKPKSEVQEDDEPPLNEDDDDDDDLDDLEGEDLQNTNHLVLAQFEKVNRTKSRWKCTLKDGIMHLNNKDILFTKANGEFDF